MKAESNYEADVVWAITQVVPAASPTRVLAFLEKKMQQRGCSRNKLFNCFRDSQAATYPFLKLRGHRAL